MPWLWKLWTPVENLRSALPLSANRFSSGIYRRRARLKTFTHEKECI